MALIMGADVDIEQKTILITGATGYIGRRLVEVLQNRSDLRLRVLVRNRHKLAASVVDKVELVEGDTFNMTALQQATEGVDTAFYLIHSMGSDRDFRELDKKSGENFLSACIAGGVRRIVYLGGLGKKTSASSHLLSRIETGEILSKEPEKIQTLWLRAGAIIGSGSISFEIIRNLTQKLPVMITPKWVRSRTQPISIEDVLSYLTGCIDLAYSQNCIIDIGAEPLTFEEMMQQAAEQMGLRRYLIPVPFLSPTYSSYWLILFTPIPRKIATALVQGLKYETLVQNDNASKLFPQIHPISYEEAVRRATIELEQNQVISRWCDSSKQDACDIKDFDNPAGAIIRDQRIMPLNGRPREQVFKSVCSLGGESGWYRYTFLWQIRGIIDKLLGGYGLNRGRRIQGELRIGDALDFWKVADIRPNKRLLLLAQMKLPGRAWLEYDLQPDQLVQTAHYLPNGVWGRIYWYLLIPLHHFVFNDLIKKIIERANHTESAP
ncbi:MAG: SDR family oxidoreductase [Desulforhopalus sp.]